MGIGEPCPESGRRVASRVRGEDLIAPAHLPAEVTSVVRGWSLGGHLDDLRARAALENFADLGVLLVPLEQLTEDAWELRHHVSAYDAFYVALARRVACQLLTLDRRLAVAAPDCALLA